MSDHLIKVEGHPSLARSRKSGAIVNINKSSINQARAAKSARKKESENVNARLNNLEDKVDKMLSILEEVVSHG